ncbi:MAG TPA: hypothetical protein VK826_18595 [Bacteroidia bacterium]|nr:hypothetical protein [Bacteroidia bacterium]
MSRFYVTCPWCKSQFHQPDFSNCTNCGGALPVSESGGGPGSPPPPAPRVLPKSYVRSVKYFGNTYTLIGIIFTIPFFWTVIFPIIGIILWRKGIREANAELVPLEHGAHTEGKITNIAKDYTKKINGVSPKILTFVFESGGAKHVGTVPNLMDPVVHLKQPGDKIWVVYLPDNPSVSSVWPPMK